MIYIFVALAILFGGPMLEMWNFKRAVKQKKNYKGYEHLLTNHSYKKAKQSK
ncbi:MAG: hypothetical protein ACTHK8_02095 [Ginsengibacter sp.]